MKSMHLIAGTVAVFAVLIGGTVALTAPQPVSPEALRPSNELRGSGALDGFAFESKVGPIGKPAIVDDTLVFADGLFVSTECERRCSYPARPYFVREKKDLVEFISETRCPNKDAKLVWRGTFDGNVLKGEFTWTTARWYWTFEKTFWFEGVLSERTASIKGR